jgi:ClpP class serine protease
MTIKGAAMATDTQAHPPPGLSGLLASRGFWLIRQAALESMKANPPTRNDRDRFEAARAKDATLAAPRRSMARGGTPIEGVADGWRSGGVAVVRLRGVMFHGDTEDDEFLAWLYGGRLTGQFTADIKAAASAPRVHTVLLDIDSPGGDALGMSEMSDAIREVGESVRVAAYTPGVMASAAYWAGASAARGSVFAAPDALVGSIGSVLQMYDTTGMLESFGIREFVFRSKQSPHKWADPKTESGKAVYQREADAFGGSFVAAVARLMDRTEADVLSDFGGGETLIGREAEKVGMVDRTMSFDRLLSELAENPAGAGARLVAASRGGRGAVRASRMESAMPKLSWNEVGRRMGLITQADDTIDFEGDLPPATPPPVQDAAPPQQTPPPDPLAIERGRLAAERQQFEAARQQFDAERKAALRASAEAGVRNASDAFKTRLAAEKRAFGDVANALHACHLQCGLDDLDSPLADGKARTASLESLAAMLPAIETGERASSDPLDATTTPDASGNRALPNPQGRNPADDDAPLTEDAARKLLADFPEGRAILSDAGQWAAYLTAQRAAGRVK